MLHVVQKWRVKMEDDLYEVRVLRFVGRLVEGIGTWEVKSTPEIRREILQWQRYAVRGSDEFGTEKVVLVCPAMA